MSDESCLSRNSPSSCRPKHYERESNAVEVLVGRVRRKLGAGVIETHRGFGILDRRAMKLLQSIRFRLLLFSLVGTLAGNCRSPRPGMVTLFGRHVERRVEQELDQHIATLVGNLRVGTGWFG